jgi:hypothetical protein
MQVLGLFACVNAQRALQSMDRNSPVRVMFLHPRPILHRDEHEPKIVRLEKKLGKQP